MADARDGQQDEAREALRELLDGKLPVGRVEAVCKCYEELSANDPSRMRLSCKVP